MTNMSGAKMSARLPTRCHEVARSSVRARLRRGRPLVRSCPSMGLARLLDLDLAALLVDVDVLVLVPAFFCAPAALLAGWHAT